MVSICTCCQVLGFGLGIVGFLGTIIVCTLPIWTVTESDIKTAQIICEGLWMKCVMNSTGKMQCKSSDSLLDLQATRGLTVISIIVCLFAIILGVTRSKCNNFVKTKGAKIKVSIASSIYFIFAGVLCLILIHRTTSTIILDFFNPIRTNSQFKELGATLYIGNVVASILLLSGLGGLLCSCCPPQEKKNYNNAYTPSATNKPTSHCRSTRQRIVHSS